ncbi:MAG: TIR domain-containing protein [Geminicoccaceae bacterium]
MRCSPAERCHQEAGSALSDIFISHSSRDEEETSRICDWLKSLGYSWVFLDYDRDNGIPAGANWEQKLYRELRICRAVIVLLSDNWLASHWCFAEYTQARAAGKYIIPVRIAACNPERVLTDIQHVGNLYDNDDSGYAYLEQGLKQAGLESEGSFPWQSGQSPFPGLAPFEDKDAAVFFGRDKEIKEGMDRLAISRRTFSDSGFMLMLGPSGGGKSSLLCAGLWPRLRKNRQHWLLIPPFRPRNNPFRGLAKAVAKRFNDIKEPKDPEDVQAKLERAADQDPPEGRVLLDLAEDLQSAEGQDEASVLIAIDQLEELFNVSRQQEADRFLGLIATALTEAQGQILAVATLRSDFLGTFQEHTKSVSLAFEPLTIGFMSSEQLPEVIQRPAQRAGIDLEQTLVTAMIQDMETDDALPLLAFTLKQLYDTRGEQTLLGLNDYDRLGRIAGSVQQQADDVIRELKPNDPKLEALRGAFIPGMVRMNEAGQAVRKPVRQDEVPEAAKPLINGLLKKRLLVLGSDEHDRPTLEVVHEALLRNWPILTTWLADDGENLRRFDGVRQAAEAWDANGRKEAWLVHRDDRLTAVEDLVKEPRFKLKEQAESDYFDACLERRQEEIKAAQRLKSQNRTYQASIVAAVVALFIVGIGGYRVYVNLRDAKEAGELTAKSMAEGGNEAGIESALEATTLQPDNADAKKALENAVFRYPHPIVELKSKITDIRFAGFRSDNEVLTVSGKGDVRLWNAETGILIRHLIKIPDVLLADINTNGSRLAAILYEKPSDQMQHPTYKVGVWDIGETKRVAISSQEPAFTTVVMGPDGDRIVTIDLDDEVRIWTIADDDISILRSISNPDEDKILSARFDPNGEQVVTGSEKGVVQFWGATDGISPSEAKLETKRNWVDGLGLSEDEKWVATRSTDNIVEVWNLSTDKNDLKIEHEFGSVIRSLDFISWIDFSGQKRVSVLTAAKDGVRISDPEAREELAYHSSTGPSKLLSARFDLNGQRVITASDDDTVRIWWCRSFDNFEQLLSEAKRLLSIGKAGGEDRQGALER